MISVRVLHEEVRRGLNQINSDSEEAINVVDIDAYINRSVDFILQSYSVLAESNKTLENHLRELEVPNKLLIENKKLSNDVYSVFEFPKDYYNYLKINVFASDINNSHEDYIWDLAYYQKDDVSLYDPMWEPSWEWRAGGYNIDSTGILIYHNSKFIPKEVTLSYIKTIPQVAAPSLVIGKQYVTADGKTYTKDVDLEITATPLWRLIVALTEFYIKKDQDKNYQKTIESILFQIPILGESR